MGKNTCHGAWDNFNFNQDKHIFASNVKKL